MAHEEWTMIIYKVTRETCIVNVDRQYKVSDKDWAAALKKTDDPSEILEELRSNGKATFIGADYELQETVMVHDEQVIWGHHEIAGLQVTSITPP